MSESNGWLVAGEIELIKRVYVVQRGFGPLDQAFKFGPFYIQANRSSLHSQSLLRYIS
jgi:hypothetical protein